MSQPLWFLRHDARVIGPFPAPLVWEFLRNGEIDRDWEISLDEVDWLSIADSGQFEEAAAGGDRISDSELQAWRAEREQARHRWLNDAQDIAHAETHDLALERRARQAMVQHQAQTDDLLRAEQGRRPPVVAGLLALCLVLGAVYVIWQGQLGESAMQAGIGLKASCATPPGEAVNWTGCDKRGLLAPGVHARNMRMAGIDLEGANLAGADLSYAVLTRANLRNANLSGARLIGADLGGADLGGADLSTADLSYAVLKGARLQGVRLDAAQLGKATWSDGHACAAGAMGRCP